MASTWTLPTTLSPPLSGREAVIDALYRAVLSFDSDDYSLLSSAFTEDTNFTLNEYVMNGLAAIKKDCFDRVAKLNTTHFVTNTRVSINEGGNTAKLSASALAQHYRAGAGLAEPRNAPRYLTGSFYMLDLIKLGDGLWKITNFDMKVGWTEGDSSVMAS